MHVDAVVRFEAFSVIRCVKNAPWSFSQCCVLGNSLVVLWRFSFSLPSPSSTVSRGLREVLPLQWCLYRLSFLAILSSVLFSSCSIESASNLFLSTTLQRDPMCCWFHGAAISCANESCFCCCINSGAYSPHSLHSQLWT